jgi:hypothetical protein
MKFNLGISNCVAIYAVSQINYVCRSSLWGSRVYSNENLP